MAHEPSLRDEAVRATTGKGWSAWFRLLDAAGARRWAHPEVAAWLQERHRVPDWWCQTITVEYERARGLRKVGQRLDGRYEVSVQRTVAQRPARVREAWTDADALASWAPGRLRAPLGRALPAARRTRTAMGDVLRFDLPGRQPGKVEVMLTPKGRGKVAVRLTHRGLPTRADRARWRARWADALDRLQGHLEPPSEPHSGSLHTLVKAGPRAGRDYLPPGGSTAVRALAPALALLLLAAPHASAAHFPDYAACGSVSPVGNSCTRPVKVPAQKVVVVSIGFVGRIVVELAESPDHGTPADTWWECESLGTGQDDGAAANAMLFTCWGPYTDGNPLPAGTDAYLRCRTGPLQRAPFAAAGAYVGPLGPWGCRVGPLAAS